LVVPLDATDLLCHQPLECNARSGAISNKKINPTMQRMKLRAANHAIKCSKRGALADPGANGGMLGNDAKVVFRRNKSVHVTGIDNHELSSFSCRWLMLQPRPLLTKEKSSSSYGIVHAME